MTTAIPPGGYPREHGTMTLATSQGTLTLKIVTNPKSPAKLTVQGGTNAHAGYSGSGTVALVVTGSDVGLRIFKDTNTFKLKLKT